ncbi:hypothetical protein LRH25_27905 [Ideonella azotifigens]|uniref:Uncharacterized protein n=1 Tax=Ideonella azotifigens TaxID=513160 RepID=A0ABN1KIF5_9BURK|nr:hypothetical protein [Ideonella azotifigens]MCD2344153.1 hypothetical protein [Ideonella azotifigens]
MKMNKTLLSVVTAAAVAGALSMAYAQSEPNLPVQPDTPTAVEPHATQVATPMVPPPGDFTGSQSSGTTTTTVEAPQPVVTVTPPATVAYTAPAPAPAAPAPETSPPVDNSAPAPIDNTPTTMPAPQADRN